MLNFNYTALVELLIFDTVLTDRQLIIGGSPSTPRKYQVPYLDECVTLRTYHNRNDLERWLPDTLCEIIAAATKDQDVLVPISGGLDSRILLACASRVLDPKRIHCVTFGSHEGNFEFRIAQRVCDQLGVVDHRFIHLGINEYEESIPLMAQLTNGEVSAYHCHLLSFFEKEKGSLPPVLLSGLLADAVSGYGQKINEESIENYQESSIYSRLLVRGKQLMLLEEQIVAVEMDIRQLWGNYQEVSYPKSFSEYFYITQRNGNALLRLADVYDSFFKTIIIPFGHPMIAGVLTSMPRDLRHGKHCLRVLLDKEFSDLSGIPTYSSIEDTRVFSERVKRLVRRGVTFLEYSGDLIFQDKIPIWNPWQNEMHGRLLRTKLRKTLKYSCELLVEQGYLSPDTARHLASKHYLSWWHTAQFHCLSMAHLCLNNPT